jgi:hypothetical protein
MEKVESIIERTIKELEKRGYNVKQSRKQKSSSKSKSVDVSFAKKLMFESMYRIHEIAKDKAQYNRMYYVLNSEASFSHEDAMTIIDFHSRQSMIIQQLMHEYFKEKTQAISE